MDQIDVAVLTKNNAKTIAQCLDAIKKNIDVSKLVLIDDSDDRGETLRIASKYTDQIHMFSGNIGEKRDYAIDLVVAPIFAFVDSDIIVNRAAFLRSMEILGSDESIAAVHNRGNSIDPRVSFGEETKQNLTFGFALLRSAALKESRIPHLPKGEDAATGIRLQRLGYRVAWQGEFACSHLKTLVDTYLHFFRYGERGHYQGRPTFVIRNLIKRPNMKTLVLQLFLFTGYTEYRLRRFRALSRENR
jgi:glycosyltransferase involved in cell wall biosynthesis